MGYIKTHNEKYLKHIKCPKCGYEWAVLDTKQNSICCAYCMYRDVPKKDIKDLTDKELEQEIYINKSETHDKKRLQRLLDERNRRVE